MSAVLTALGHLDPPAGEPGPGPFRFAVPGYLQELLETAGFGDVEIDAVDFTFPFASLDGYFEVQSDCSPTVGPALANLSPAQHTAFRDALDEHLAVYVQADGTVELPARTLVAAAGA
jgi:hypothetical protein